MDTKEYRRTGRGRRGIRARWWAGQGHRRKRKGSITKLTPGQREKARILARDRGIPYDMAVLVVVGRTTVNDVLKELWARERRDQLVSNGLSKALAGQVARGRMSLERAKSVQEFLDQQGMGFRRQKFSELVGKKVALSLFGNGMLVCELREVGRYTLSVLPEDTIEPQEIRKHEIRYYCRPEVAKAALESESKKAEVAALKLGASASLADRFRPGIEQSVDWVRSGAKLTFNLRDGATLEGVPKRVGFYEIDLELENGALVHLMTHALYRPNPFERAAAI